VLVAAAPKLPSIWIPSDVLPEITLGPAAVVPSIWLLLLRTYMPAAFGRASVPPVSTPIQLPWTRLPPPDSRMP